MNISDIHNQNTSSEYTVHVPRFSIPKCIEKSKSELQESIQARGIDLPEYENKSYGERHNLRWSSSILFANGSIVSISAIFKLKKDADKAVAYKAKKIGLTYLLAEKIISEENLHEDIGLMIQCFKEDGSEVDREIARAYNAKQYMGIRYEDLVSDVTPSRVKDKIGCVQTEPPSESVLNDVDRLELPFVFPIHQEENPFISMLCESCLKSQTQRRQIFAYGRTSTWSSAWTSVLSKCIQNQGVIIVSPEAEYLVVDALSQYSILHVQTPNQVPDTLVSCVITSEMLKQVDLNKLFPTERPILLIDSSPKWMVTWQLMVFLPTFHIASYCLFEIEENSPVIQINLLRDVYNCDLITQICCDC